SGTFVNWEGRAGEFPAALQVPVVRDDRYVLAGIADAMDVHLGLPDASAARRELAALGAAPQRTASSQALPRHAASGGPAASSADTGVLLATWHNLLDAGRMQDGEPNLAGTARPAVAKMSAATAAAAGVGAGAKVSVATSRGEIRVLAEITAMPDRV